MSVFSIPVEKTCGLFGTVRLFRGKSTRSKDTPLFSKVFGMEKVFGLKLFFPVMSLFSKEIFRRKIVLQKMVWFVCFQLGNKWFSSLMRTNSGIFRHCKIDKNFNNSILRIFKKLVFLKHERGADLGRSRLHVYAFAK